ncbi:MAG: hypothetical protein FWG34_08140 [Oscillospiraceae bacterium]|nr:hypothetical protein [Oscillospiraceae bacterium]
MRQYSVTKNVEIINEIIEIEAGAQEMMKNARREEERLQETISGILEEYSVEQNRLALENIKSFGFFEESAAKKETDRIYRENGQKLEKLKKITDENMDAWIDEIYAFVTAPTEIS